MGSIQPQRLRLPASKTLSATIAQQVVLDIAQLVGHDLSRPGGAVRVIGELMVDHGLPGTLGLGDVPVRLLQGHRLVALAVVDHDRDLDLVGEIHGVQPVHGGRLGLAEERIGVEARPDPLVVGDARARDRALVQAVGANRGGHGGIAAVGEAEHGDPPALRDALVDHPQYGGGHKPQPRTAHHEGNHNGRYDHGYQTFACPPCLQCGEPDAIGA